jgi:hypothetical protein
MIPTRFLKASPTRKRRLAGLHAEDDILRVWQNHGLQVEGVPEGFKLAGDFLSLQKSNDGQTLRRADDLRRSVSPRKIV